MQLIVAALLAGGRVTSTLRDAARAASRSSACWMDGSACGCGSDAGSARKCDEHPRTASRCHRGTTWSNYMAVIDGWRVIESVAGWPIVVRM